MWLPGEADHVTSPPDGPNAMRGAGRRSARKPIAAAPSLPALAVRHAHLPVLWPSRRGRSTPADPDTYDYTHAARDALHFAALFDRFIHNLRRFTGYDLQYFAAIELQRRLAPHVHLAIRGTISRQELREVVAATYHQVWWPSTQAVTYDGDCLPVWDEHTRDLPRPGHRRGAADLGPGPRRHRRRRAAARGPVSAPRFDAQGVLAGSRDASRCIGYLTKYLGDCHQATTGNQADHATRLADALPYEPCSPTCANWLRFGIQLKNARPGLRPGCCKGKAHRREYLGYAGRRVLVSRKWSGKTLADHRADRKAWLTGMLGFPATDPGCYDQTRRDPSHEYPASSGMWPLPMASGCMCLTATRTAPTA